MHIPGPHSEEQIQEDKLRGPETGRWSGLLWSSSLTPTPQLLGILFRPILLESWEGTGGTW